MCRLSQEGVLWFNFRTRVLRVGTVAQKVRQFKSASVQLPAPEPGRAAKDIPSAWAPEPAREICSAFKDSSVHLAHSYWWMEPEDGRFLPFTPH